MGTNGIDMTSELEPIEPSPLNMLRKRALDTGAPDAGRTAATGGFALAPLVDKIAYGIAKGLVVAMKELEDHIASETRKVGDAVDRRLDTIQATLADLSRFVGEQEATNVAVQGQLEDLALGLREADARRAADAEALRKEAQESAAALSQRIDATIAAQQESHNEQSAGLAALQSEARAFSRSVSERIDGLCTELGVQQEDIAAVKTALGAFSSRVDALAERLDRQADAVRSMCTAYSQRETELEQLVDGLARLRAFPTPMPVNRL